MNSIHAITPPSREHGQWYRYIRFPEEVRHLLVTTRDNLTDFACNITSGMADGADPDAILRTWLSVEPDDGLHCPPCEDYDPNITYAPDENMWARDDYDEDDDQD